MRPDASVSFKPCAACRHTLEHDYPNHLCHRYGSKPSIQVLPYHIRPFPEEHTHTVECTSCAKDALHSFRMEVLKL